MKKWIKDPQMFMDIFCQLPLSIHTQKQRNYAQFAVGKGKSELDVVLEVSWRVYSAIMIMSQGFSYLDITAECFHRQFGSSDSLCEEPMKQWISFLLTFLKIADVKSSSIIAQVIQGNKQLLSNTSLWNHFILQVCK